MRPGALLGSGGLISGGSMDVVLVMFRADGDRRSFSLARDMTVIGRREDCDLRIPVGDVSRKHCRLVREADTLRLEDLGSSNGTFVNGQRVQEAVVRAGDNVQVGPVQFVVQIDGYPADEDLTEPAAAPADPDATGGFPVLEELQSEEPVETFAATDTTAGVDDPPAPPLPDFTLAPAAAPAEELELGSGLDELPVMDEGPAEQQPQAWPAPPTPPALHETQALPAHEVPSPGLVRPETVPTAGSKQEDDGEWNFVLEEAEPESAEDVDLGLNAPHEGGHG